MTTPSVPAATSRRPYLLRAMHEWITDNGQTPHVIVDAGIEGVQVPQGYVKDGKIVLNVAYAAANGLKMGNEWIEFDARFGGVPHRVRVPLRAAVGIYSRETGQGMAFSDSDLAPEPDPPAGPPADSAADSAPEARRARFKVVK